MRTIEIKNRFTGAVMYAGKHETIKAAVIAANLSGVNLSSANLSGADLSYANLSGANFLEAGLWWANLTAIKADLFLVLALAMPDVAFLHRAMIDGKINGSTYKDDCGMGCLVGTIAIHRQISEHQILGLTPDPSHPVERWFLRFKPGMTPDTDPAMNITLSWIEEFMKEHGIEPLTAEAAAREQEKQ